MSRIPDITERDQLPEDERHIFDEIVGSRGSVRGPFKVMLHSAELARRTAHTGAYIRFESKLDARVRELTAVTTARLLDCDYEHGAHENAARGMGIPETTLAAIRELRPADLPAEDRWIYELVEQLIVGHRIANDTFQVAQQRLGVPGLVEMVGVIGYYGMIAAPLNAFEVQRAE